MMTPGSANALLLADAGYQIQRSVRLRQSASAYLNRTSGAAPTSNQKGTFSFWLKRGLLGFGTEQWLFAGGGGSMGAYIPTLDRLGFEYFGGSYLVTTQFFRDPSAWYHLTFAVDTTQATAANRAKLYVNGVQVTSFATEQYPAQNATFNWMANGQACYINQLYSGGRYFDGYMADFNYIDGQALTPASFGEINPVTGVWSAKKYAGTYGTNGFYLNFSDNSAATAAAIGKDSSGNGNNWTPNNISVTAGVTYDSMLDVPLGAGGAERGNYCTLNPLVAPSMGTGAMSSGNLQVVTPTAGASNNYGGMGVSNGKWFWEVTIVARAVDSHVMIGVAGDNQIHSATEFYAKADGYCYRGNGEKFNAGTGTAYGTTSVTGAVIGVALDLNAKTIEFFNQGVSMGVAFTGMLDEIYYPAVCDTGTTIGVTYNFNFGQRPFAYTPPTGFKALHTGNLPEPVIKKGNQWFDATTYTGTGVARSVTNAGGFQPDLVWVKVRSAADHHILYDSLRGTKKQLYSNLTNAEETETTGGLTAFATNGFTLSGAAHSVRGQTNDNGQAYIAWQWKANGAAVSNTAGSITSQVSAGVSQGFSVVTYTGTGANATVGHGLGVAPKMVIVKNRSGVFNWFMYNSNLPSNLYYMSFNTTDAQSNSGGATLWNSSSPTSTVFSLGTAAAANGSGNNLVAYCFSEVAGYSKFGSYIGNGSADGPFVFCGFRPKYVMVKCSSSPANGWLMWDTSRDLFNVTGLTLQANDSAAEFDRRTNPGYLDVLSNGFKARDTSTGVNQSGQTYIFACFAEAPFKNSLAR